MKNSTDWTPFPDDNKLGITDPEELNKHEARGIALAEYYLFTLDSDMAITTNAILDIHRKAFSELYLWAGKWRDVDVRVGQLTPPSPNEILQLMYQFVENLNFKISQSSETESRIECLAYAHYNLVRIHPFNNGNGRTARLLMNLVGLKFGFEPFDVYQREGGARRTYINAIQAGDLGDLRPLEELIRKELRSF